MAGHLAGWQDRTINRLRAVGRGEPEPASPWPADLKEDDEVDKINAWIREQHADRSPEQLVADYDGSYDRLIEALEGLPPTCNRPWSRGPESPSSTSTSPVISATSTSPPCAHGSTDRAHPDHR
jgi:hypothetical protein